MTLWSIVNGLYLLTFSFVHLKWNKFETSNSFVNSHLIGNHLLFDNQSKIFWMHLIWFWWEIVLKWIWESLLKSLNILVFRTQKFFIKISICYISYLQAWLKMFDPWNCIDIPYWALSSCPFIDNFLGTLSSDDEWWLGWGNFSLLGFWFKLYFEHYLDVKIYFFV